MKLNHCQDNTITATINHRTPCQTQMVTWNTFFFLLNFNFPFTEQKRLTLRCSWYCSHEHVWPCKKVCVPQRGTHIQVSLPALVLAKRETISKLSCGHTDDLHWKWRAHLTVTDHMQHSSSISGSPSAKSTPTMCSGLPPLVKTKARQASGSICEAPLTAKFPLLGRKTDQS